MNWKKFLYEIGNDAETKLDLYKLKLREKLGWTLPVQICPYITYGNSEVIYLRGRVMNNRSIISDDTDTIFENLVNMYKRLASEEIAGAQLKVTYNKTEYLFTTDEDGYFEFPLKLNIALPSEQLWHNPLLELLDCPVKFEKPLLQHARVMTPPVMADFGIISDIDDTILPSHAGEILKMAYTTFTKNQFTRFPFKGVAAFYNSLQKGITGQNFNPLFYVSSSPWNLYDLLVEFFKVNNIPEGPLLLKDYGFTHNKLLSESHFTHKLKMIRNVLNSYPELPFILIGDSGQKDPEIYSDIIKEFPGRIIAVYIRDVSDNFRDLEIKTISESNAEYNIEIICCEDTLKAAAHAASRGFIRKADLDLIAAEIN